MSVNDDSVVVRLTDRDGLTYDVRGVAAGDVGELNAVAQQETDGELWWEVVHTAGIIEWNVPGQAAEFDDVAAAQQFKAAHPDWQVFFTKWQSVAVGEDGGLTAVTQADLLRRLEAA
jgi:hypothetical protein